MEQINLANVPAQRLNIVLASQNVQIYIYQKTTGLFVDVNVNGNDVSLGVLARDIVRLVPADYMAFDGQLMFTDTQGDSDPDYTGLGSRFQLLYMTTAEYEQLQQF